VTHSQNVHLRSLYPEIEPYQHFFIAGDAIDEVTQHQIYVECCGNPEGIPVLFLHGGPGSGCRPNHRRYFDPKLYHIILFDQRGCGRSTPVGSLTHNSTAHLIKDIEAIRRYLHLEKWLLFAGSWGTTLALSYAIAFPDTVLALILRGVFLGREEDINWVYAQSGAARLFPAQWQQLMSHLSPEQQQQPLESFHSLLHDPLHSTQLSTAKALYQWQACIGHLTLRESATAIDETQLLAHFHIQLHYALAQCFIADKPILKHVQDLTAIPTWIVQGQYDLVCPSDQSWALHQALTQSQLKMVHLAGHAGDEPEIIDALISITDATATRFQHLIS